MPTTFVISDESLNSYGFRILTDGIDVSQWKKNPVMLWMHQRQSSWAETKVLPIGRWDNIRKENGKLLADAVFDDNDEFAQTIKQKVENGFLKMASPGVVIVEKTSDPKVMLKGQTRETVSKCKIREASIVDIGSNDNALKLYSEDNSIIELSDLNNSIPAIKLNNNNTMNLKELLIALFSGTDVNLSAESTDSEIVGAVKSLLSKSMNHGAELSAKNTKISELEQKLNDANTEKVKSFIDAEAKRTGMNEEQKKAYLSLAEKDFDSTKAVLSAMPTYKSIKNQLAANNDDTDDRYKDFSFEDYQKKAPKALLELKANDPEKYKELFNKQFGKDPQN